MKFDTFEVRNKGCVALLWQYSNKLQFNMLRECKEYGQIHLPIMDRTSVKCAIKFFFHSNSMKLGEVFKSTHSSRISIEFKWKTKKFFNETLNGQSVH